MNEDGFDNRADWRISVQRCLGIGVDPFAARAWSDPRDIASALRCLCSLNVSSTFTPGGGSVEFSEVESTGGNGLRLDAAIGVIHKMQVSRLDYIPHPIDPADAIFRLELYPSVPLTHGAVSVDGYREGMVRSFKGAVDSWSDYHWLRGIFVFVAKSGLFNQIDPHFDCWDETSAEELGEGLARMCHRGRWESLPYQASQQGPLHILAASPLAVRIPPGWVDVWLEMLPYTMPSSAVQAAAARVVKERDVMPAFPEFRELCDRAREGHRWALPL